MDHEENFTSTLEELPLVGSMLAVPPKSLGNRGVPFGIAHGRQMQNIDPLYMKHIKLVSALIFMVIGRIGSGKTSLSKVLAMRYAPFVGMNGRMQLGIEDHKVNDDTREWGPLANFFGSDEVNLSGIQLNIFDPLMLLEFEELMAMLVDMIMHVRSTTRGGQGMIEDAEILGLKTGLKAMHRYGDDSWSMETFIDILDSPGDLFPRTPSGKKMNIGREGFDAACGQVVMTLDRLCGGDFGNTFGGKDSIAPLFKQPAVAFNYVGVEAAAMTLMMAVTWRWRAAAQNRRDPNFMRDVLICDENWKMWMYLVYAMAMYEYIKTVRSTGGMVLLNAHKLGDYKITDDKAGALARGMLSHVAGTFAGGLDPPDAAEFQEFLGFSDKVRAMLENLDTGEYVYISGKQAPVRFRIRLTPYEEEICESDQATTRIMEKSQERFDANALRAAG